MLIAFLYSTSLLSQSYKGRVLDAVEKTPISFVNIGVTKDGRETVSDIEGNYMLADKRDQEIRTFSSISYKTIDIAGGQLRQDSIVWLEPMSYKADIRSRYIIGIGVAKRL